MTWAPQETQKALYDIMIADTALTTLLGGAFIFDHVPDNTTYPYIYMQIKPWTDRGNHTWEGMACELTLHTFYRAPGRGDLEVQKIQNRIDQLFHSQDICIDGWNIVVFRRAFVDILKEADNVTLHGVQKFKLFLGEA